MENPFVAISYIKDRIGKLTLLLPLIKKKTAPNLNKEKMQHSDGIIQTTLSLTVAESIGTLAYHLFLGTPKVEQT
jgi:hypothetical protein